MKNAELKNLKVKEIMEMIKEENLKYNSRMFVYKNIPVTLDSGKKTTKAGEVINFILEQDIALPCLTFWKNTDTKELYVLSNDDLQRVLSIYYFINPSVEINIATIINGREYLYGGLPTALKEELLNYDFFVQIIEGNTLEFEKSYEAVNTNAIPHKKKIKNI